MNNEPAQDRSVVLAVVVFLGALALLGVAAMAVLVFKGVDAGSIALIGGPTTTAIGALAGILASTRSTPAAAAQQQQAVGYQKAIDQVNELGAIQPTGP